VPFWSDQFQVTVTFEYQELVLGPLMVGRAWGATSSLLLPQVP
jgi:hypothetical protein